MLVYIISDINKSLQLEWTLKNINKKLKLKVILINCKDSKLQFFLSKNRIEYQNIKCNKLLNLTQYELSQIVNLINGKCHKSLKINKMLNETKFLITF